MNKLKQDQNNYYITKRIPFIPKAQFTDSVIKKIFEFSYAMAFEKGEHRAYRSGGKEKRTKGQIFINAFQGKIAEIAVYNDFKKYNISAYKNLSKPDLAIHPLGIWDNYDIELGDTKFAIKSTKFYGNLLLLETKDWNNDGEYLPNKNLNKECIYDYFILVRIKPDGEKLLDLKSLLYSNEIIDKDFLFSLINSEAWVYDIAGYISNEELKYIIHNKFILPQDALLNGKIPMDAENYYVQSGDMMDTIKLIASL